MNSFINDAEWLRDKAADMEIAESELENHMGSYSARRIPKDLTTALALVEKIQREFPDDTAVYEWMADELAEYFHFLADRLDPANARPGRPAKRT